MLKPEKNAFASSAKALGTSINDLLGGDNDSQNILIADIVVRTQVRTEFEDATDTLEDLAASIKKLGVIQAIVLRPLPFGKYELVAGERRLRAAVMAGLDDIPGKVLELTDEQAADIQFAENIHRKNLTMLEEARKIQNDLDQLGSVEAVLAKHNKNKSWLSKRLSLLTLGPEAKRLLDENISADLELIGEVKQIEKVSPEKAKAVVDDLATKGRKGDARATVSKVKNEVKPPKSGAAKKAAPKNATAGDDAATPRDRSHETPGTVMSVFPALPSADKTGNGEPQQKPVASAAGAAPATEVDAMIAQLCDGAKHGNRLPEQLVAELSDTDRASVDAVLVAHFDEGKRARDVSKVLIAGLRAGTFSTDGPAGLSLAAFAQGVEQNTAFSLSDALSAIRYA